MHSSKAIANPLHCQAWFEAQDSICKTRSEGTQSIEAVLYQIQTRPESNSCPLQPRQSHMRFLTRKYGGSSRSSTDSYLDKQLLSL